MAGSTVRRLVLAMTIDASGVSPGFADLQKQAIENNAKIAQINAEAKNLRDKFKESGLKDDPEAKAAYEQAQQLLSYKKTYYQSLNELRLQDMEMERARLRQEVGITQQMRTEDEQRQKDFSNSLRLRLEAKERAGTGIEQDRRRAIPGILEAGTGAQSDFGEI